MSQSKRARARGRPGRWRGWGYGLGAVAIVVLLLRGLGPVDGAATSGGRAPEFRVRTLAGEAIGSRDLAGQVVLVNFWATWCPPCRAEMPGFERVWREQRSSGFVVLGISADGGQEAVAAFAREQGITYPLAMLDAAVQASFGGVNGLPMSWLIDRDGAVQRVVTGIYEETQLRADVARLVAQR